MYYNNYIIVQVKAKSLEALILYQYDIEEAHSICLERKIAERNSVPIYSLDGTVNRLMSSQKFAKVAACCVYVGVLCLFNVDLFLLQRQT